MFLIKILNVQDISSHSFICQARQKNSNFDIWLQYDEPNTDKKSKVSTICSPKLSEQPSLRPGLHAQHYSAYIVYFGLISHNYFIATNAV